MPPEILTRFSYDPEEEGCETLGILFDVDSSGLKLRVQGCSSLNIRPYYYALLEEDMKAPKGYPLSL